MADAEEQEQETVEAGVIRVTLASLPTVTGVPAEHGHRLVGRDAIERAGLDTIAVAVWVRDNGGFERTGYLRAPAEAATGAIRPPLQPFRYYSVPVAALEPPA